MPQRPRPESTTVATSLIPDPFQMWREALTKLEGNVNSLVTGSMRSPLGRSKRHIEIALPDGMVYLTGYGFPLHRGGPMHYADQQGLFNVAQAMKRFAANPRDDQKFWQPAPLLAKLAAEGKTFS